MTTKKNTAEQAQPIVETQPATTKATATNTKKSSATKNKKANIKKIAEQLAQAKEQNDKAQATSTGGVVNIEQPNSDDALKEFSPEAQEFIKTGKVATQDKELQQEQPTASEKKRKGRPASPIKKKKILIYLPEELVERLNKIVQEAGQSRVGYIQRAITTAVKLSEKE